jgi:hypothetical protein
VTTTIDSCAIWHYIAAVACETGGPAAQGGGKAFKRGTM